MPLSWLMGGFVFARIVHFFMSAIVGFMVVRVTPVALVPKTLLVMTIGRATARAHASAPIQPQQGE